MPFLEFWLAMGQTGREGYARTQWRKLSATDKAAIRDRLSRPRSWAVDMWAGKWLECRVWEEAVPARASVRAPEQVHIRENTPEWRCWQRYLAATKGKGTPVDNRGGWWFPSKLPPLTDAEVPSKGQAHSSHLLGQTGPSGSLAAAASLRPPAHGRLGPRVATVTSGRCRPKLERTHRHVGAASGVKAHIALKAGRIMDVHVPEASLASSPSIVFHQAEWIGVFTGIKLRWSFTQYANQIGREPTLLQLGKNLLVREDGFLRLFLDNVERKHAGYHP
jgi:hypothetical protein